MQNKKSYQITIKGRVQNVGFRYHTYKKAIELNITGFVKNKPNGDVYVEAEGFENNTAEFINWCKKGPNWATVVETNITEQPICSFLSFEIKK